jgi:cell wall-associated NlpC family hydrolase
MPIQHLAPLDNFEQDWTDVAERFLGAPYLWGGKTSAGLDCSGLVQVALRACGIPAPRDTDMQEAALGAELPADSIPGRLRRGDLVFWKGHVGIMRDAKILLHANAHHMAVAVEPLAAAMERFSRRGLDVSSVRRVG